MFVTPIRRQYLEIKQRYPNAILFFRLGDFYETFDQDAITTSRDLDIVLTSRSMGKDVKVPMAGIPAHAVESYLAKLINQGHKVAICEQLSDPATSQGLVDRNVVRVVTPGTVIESSMLHRGANNFLASLIVDGLEAGISYMDITTGEYATTQMAVGQIETEVNRISPAELLVAEGSGDWSRLNVNFVTPVPKREFESHRGRNMLLQHFEVLTLESFGCEEKPLAIGAAAAILGYVSDTQPTVVNQVYTLKTYSLDSFMTMDAQSRRNLELFEGGRWGERGASLLATLDCTITPMGARLIRGWMGQPLLELDTLEQRQEVVTFFLDRMLKRRDTRDILSKVSDLERIMGRVSLGRSTPRDLLSMKESLKAVSVLLDLLSPDSQSLRSVMSDIRPFDDLVLLIEASINEETSGNIGEGDVIKVGFSNDLDVLRSGAKDARNFIAGLERKERESTGIKSLKVGHNRIFGYYIEVRNSSLAQVPDDYVRRQTLANGERYVTPELKEYESLIMNATARIAEIEKNIYSQVCNQISQQSRGIIAISGAIASLDVLVCFAESASIRGYTKPSLLSEGPLDIKGGRHPIVERILSSGTFVPNDLYTSTDDAQVLIITGPNMSGKSTFIRQAALITLMAQIGSFVPADSATVGLTDRIFTRIGLQDDLSRGQSTFMVEMVETAAILNQASPRSLIILDEIGRGTSTYDGLSIAKAVAEHIHNEPRLGCRTLFATHYHELTQLVESLPRVRNHTVAVTESGGNLVFLHRIVPGGADKSYGVHVAQLAGLPRAVVNRAWEILKEMESLAENGSVNSAVHFESPRNIKQGYMFPTSIPLMEEILKLDVSNMTPLEAINKLYEFQGRITHYW